MSTKTLSENDAKEIELMRKFLRAYLDWQKQNPSAGAQERLKAEVSIYEEIYGRALLEGDGVKKGYCDE